EAGALAGVGLVEQELEGDLAADVLIDGPHDRPHAAPADLAAHLVRGAGLDHRPGFTAGRRRTARRVRGRRVGRGASGGREGWHVGGERGAGRARERGVFRGGGLVGGLARGKRRPRGRGSRHFLHLLTVPTANALARLLVLDCEFGLAVRTGEGDHGTTLGVTSRMDGTAIRETDAPAA